MLCTPSSLFRIFFCFPSNITSQKYWHINELKAASAPRRRPQKVTLRGANTQRATFAPSCRHARTPARTRRCWDQNRTRRIITTLYDTSVYGNYSIGPTTCRPLYTPAKKLPVSAYMCLLFKQLISSHATSKVRFVMKLI